MPSDYRKIGNEIFEKLEPDRTRLGEALSAWKDKIRECLDCRAWNEVTTYCESAHELCDEMQGSEELREWSNVIDTAHAEGIFHAYGGISHLYQAEEAKEKKNHSEVREELTKAIDCLEKSQQSFHFFEYRDQWNEGIIYLSLGRLYRSQNKLNEALLAFQRSLYIFNRLSVEKRQEIVKAVLEEIEKTHRPFAPESEDSGGQEDSTAQQYRENHSDARAIDQKPFAPHELGFLPVLGKIAAGEPITTSLDDRYVMSNKFCTDDQEYSLQILKGGSELKLRPGHRYFALEVEGKSMIEAGIEDGDLVILKEQHVPDHNGDIVAAAVVDIEDEATLKRFHYDEDEDCVLLRFENPEMDEEFKFPRDDLRKRVEIRGVALAVLKKINR